MLAHLVLIGALFILVLPPAKAGSELSLSSALQAAFQQNHELAAAAHSARAEHFKIRSEAFLPDPMIGYERDLGMNTWLISQDIQFPTKYFATASVQRHRAQASDSELRSKQLEVRKKVIAAYFRVFSLARIHSLLEAQLNTAREIARNAENRRATGAVPQQDEMKAHVEETRANAELVMLKQETVTAENELTTLLGDSDSQATVPAHPELSPPKLKLTRQDLQKLSPESNPVFARAHAEAESMHAEQQLARMSWLPDFRLMYQQPFGHVTGSETRFRIEASIPLWFFARQSGLTSAAHSRLQAAERMQSQTRIDLKARIQSLAAKAQAQETLLKIDQTALIPQATATFNSSQSSYRVGRVGVIDLLDSQRALYNVQIGYYRTLMDYAETVADLETATNQSQSDLPLFPSLREPALAEKE